MKMERIFSWKFWGMDAKRREKLEKETGKKYLLNNPASVK